MAHAIFIPALGKQRQAKFFEFGVRVSYRTARPVTQSNPVSKNKTNKKLKMGAEELAQWLK